MEVELRGRAFAGWQLRGMKETWIRESTNNRNHFLVIERFIERYEVSISFDVSSAVL
jgi:hypothetical protein